MSTTGDAAAPRTRFLSRLLGLFCLILALSMFVRGQATVDSVTALLHDPAAAYLFGLIAVSAGLAMVLAHTRWSGGALPVVVTVIGWSTLIKGLLVLFLPLETESGLVLAALRHGRLVYLEAAVALALGGYLTYEGFRPRAR